MTLIPFLLLLSAPAAGPLRLPEGARPALHKVELTLRPTADTFDGRMVLEVDLTRVHEKLWLNAAELTVRQASVRVGEKTLRAKAEVVGADHVTVDVGHPLGPGRVIVIIDYTGKISADASSGIFHQREGGEAYLFSQFEAIEARRAFPCFDEPSFKAPWEITLRVPKGLMAVSNEPIAEETEDGELRRVRFLPTPPLPSYLIALAVGPFDVLDGGKVGRRATPVRILTPRGKAGEARFAAEVTGPLMAELESYFGQSYPFRKLDQIAIPASTRFIAMENPGLITYGAQFLLAKPDADSLSHQRTFATVAAHELGHQWFGDLVTPAWWDDIWLNEAFASWLEDKAITRWRPEWSGMAEHWSRRNAAMNTDTLPSARRIRQPIESKDDIENGFDGITYTKGRAVLEMFEGWVGEEPFRRGVQTYLERHAWDNANGHDFLTAVAESSRPELMPAFSSFLDQTGMPLIDAELHCGPEGARVELSQHRYMPSKATGGSDSIWQVPVCVRHAEGRECMLLKEKTGSLDLGKVCPNWMVANDGGVGYYRVHYRGDMARRLAAAGGKVLSVGERVSLVSDLSALAASGDTPADVALSLVVPLVKDSERPVAAAAIEVVASLEDDLVVPERRAHYARFVRAVFGPLARELGVQPKAGDSEETRLLRPAVVALVTGPGEDPVLRDEVKRLALAWLDDRRAVSPESVDLVLRLAAESGDLMLFERMLAVLGTTEDRRERASLLGALVSFRDPVLSQRAFSLSIAPGADPREMQGVFMDVMRDGTTAARRAAYAFVVHNYEAVLERTPREMQGYLPAMAGVGCDARARDAAEAFWKDRVKELEGAPRMLAQSLESISACKSRREAQLPAVTGFLARY